MEAVFLPEDMEVKGCGFGFVGLLATSEWRLSWVSLPMGLGFSGSFRNLLA